MSQIEILRRTLESSREPMERDELHGELISQGGLTTRQATQCIANAIDRGVCKRVIEDGHTRYALDGTTAPSEAGARAKKKVAKKPARREARRAVLPRAPVPMPAAEARHGIFADGSVLIAAAGGELRLAAEEWHGLIDFMRRVGAVRADA